MLNYIHLHELLGSFSVLLRLLPGGLLLVPLFGRGRLLAGRRKDCWRRQDLVKVLELLASALSVLVRDVGPIDSDNVGEAVHNKYTHQGSLRDFVVSDVHRLKGLKSFQFRHLNKAVDVVVLEQQTFQLCKLTQFGHVRRRNYVVETHILKSYLFDCFLELRVV